MTTSRRSERVWPDRLAASEGWANARVGGWVSALVLLAVAWVTGAAAAANALDVSRLVTAEQAWIAAGGHTIILEPGGSDDEAALDAATCDRLGLLPGVVGAFAVMTTSSVAAPLSAPGTRATVVSVSPGIHAFFGRDAPAAASVLATPTTLRPLGLRDGDAIVLQVTSVDGTAVGHPETVQVGLVDSPILGDDLAGTWMVPGATVGDATQCYVFAEATQLAAVRSYAVGALTGSDGTPAVVRGRLIDSGHGLGFAGAYAARPLIWASSAAAAVLIALWGLVNGSRRSQWAIYATFGADTRARAVMQVTHWTALSVPGATWGWATAISLSLGLGADPATTLVQVTSHAALTWTAATLGVLAVGLLPVGSLLDALKGRL